MSWYYRPTGPKVFTVVHDCVGRDGAVISMSDTDWPTRAEAAARCNYLNGGNADELAELEATLGHATEALRAIAEQTKRMARALETGGLG